MGITDKGGDNAPSPTSPRFYDEHYYQAKLHDHHWFRDSRAKHQLRWTSVMRLLKPHANDVVLDLGSASGTHALQLRAHVAEVIGIDFSPAAVRIANERTAAVEGVRFLESDVARLTAIADASIDKAVAIDLLEHIEDTTLLGMLDELWRVLKPGGRLVFYTPCASHYVERLKASNIVLRQLPGHIAVRSTRQYDALFSHNPWQAVVLEHLPSSFPLFGWLDRMLMSLPYVGRLFQFRIVGMLVKP